MNPAQQRLLAELTAHDNGQQRLTWLVQRAGTNAGLPAEKKTDAQRVAGCLAKLWLTVEWPGGRSRLRCDSDSRLTFALATFICDLFTDCAPHEILNGDLDFLHPAGLARQLTPNRRNAVARVWDQLQAAAQEEQDRVATAGERPPRHH